MRRMIAGLTLTLLGLTGLAWADEPFQPQVTVPELGQQCAATIGRFHVELQAAAILTTKYQAEIARLKAEIEKAKAMPAKEPESK
jgi:hypothetical protein